MSSYSPDLRIELITTGDQAGTWGTTTNTNLSYVIEQAIAGYISVAVASANQALTYINGGSATAALNQSVHANLALTTSTGANFAVYAPPASKQYTIYNASSYTATIYNSTVIGNTTAAGTGVAIPAGKTVTVWSDGTNFVFQNNHLSSLTLATDLAVADGGTGASSFTSGGLLRGNGSSALSVASASDIVTQIGSTAVTNATNATTATNAGFATYSGYSNSVNMGASTPDLALKVPYTSTTASTAGQYGLVIEPGSTFTYNPFTATLTVNNIVGDLDGTATTATNATVTTSATSSAFKIPFANTTASTTGNYGLLQDSTGTFTYNPSTNTLNVNNITADTLTANNVTATAVHVSTTAGNFKYKVPFTGTTTGVEGDYSLLMDTTTADFTYNPSTNTLAVSSITLGSANVPLPDGSAPGYLARAWVNFDGTGTVAIRDSGNVTSITDNGTGDYTVNFSANMPDANYAPFCSRRVDTQTNPGVFIAPKTLLASSLQVVTGTTTGGASDADTVSVSVFS